MYSVSLHGTTYIKPDIDLDRLLPMTKSLYDLANVIIISSISTPTVIAQYIDSQLKKEQRLWLQELLETAAIIENTYGATRYPFLTMIGTLNYWLGWRIVAQKTCPNGYWFDWVSRDCKLYGTLPYSGSEAGAPIVTTFPYSGSESGAPIIVTPYTGSEAGAPVTPNVVCPEGSTYNPSGKCVAPVTCLVGTFDPILSKCIVPVQQDITGKVLCPGGSVADEAGTCIGKVTCDEGFILDPVSMKCVGKPINDDVPKPPSGNMTYLLIGLVALAIVMGGR